LECGEAEEEVEDGVIYGWEEPPEPDAADGDEWEVGSVDFRMRRAECCFTLVHGGVWGEGTLPLERCVWLRWVGWVASGRRAPVARVLACMAFAAAPARRR
jgi:hypothetical protein